MKILITGGTSFVSKFTAEFFVKRGDEVFVLNRNSREQVAGVHLIECDRRALGDRLKGECFDAVLDITAYTAQDVKSLLDSGVSFKDYVFISTSAVYPETNPQPFTEEQQCGANSYWGDYGTNKLDAERYLSENVSNAYILRPPYFYGIYENLHREALPFDCAIADRKFCLPPNSEMKLQFFNVKDLCRFIEILLEKHPDEHIFNVGNKETVTVKRWVTLCYEAAGKKPEFVRLDENVAQQWQYFCFRDYDYVLDVTKQCALMPETTSLSEGLKEEFEWYKNNRDSVYNRKQYLEFIDSVLSVQQ